MRKTFSFLAFLIFCFSVFNYAQSLSVEGVKPGTQIKDPGNSQYIPNENLAIIYEENFNGDNTPAGLAARNWVFIDNDGAGLTTTFQGNAAVFPAFEGPTDGYVGQNFNGAVGGGFLIDQWLISPQFTVQIGDTLSFYWRAGGGQWDDSVYVKISDGGATMPDFTLNLGRFRVPDAQWVRFTYIFNSGGNKRVALQYYHTNGGPNGAHSNYWGLDLFQIIEGTVSGPGAATNPNPANNATGVSATGLQLSWTNPGGATSNSVWFGPPGNLVQIHSGSLASNVNAPSPLSYSTVYNWRVDEIDGSGTTLGSVWSFTTQPNPNIVSLFSENFESGLGQWTIINNGGTCDWLIFTPPYPNGYTLPCGAGCGGVLSADSDECGSGTTMNTTAKVTNPINAAGYTNLTLKFDNDFRILDADDHSFVEVSTNGGTTWQIVWSAIGVNVRNTTEVVNLGAYDGMTFELRFRSVQPGFDWWWVVDNILIEGVIPVELTSFTASAVSKDVVLNWTTSTEVNNMGFEIERGVNGQFTKVGFVAGHNTTTETRNYSYTDQNVANGTYSYRLKQVDFDGTFEYSPVVEVDVNIPSVYALEQNYPNPFNPSTKINFSLASDSKVTLKIYNVLGQEVMTLINGNLAAQNHTVDFDASALNSGVYFYSIEAIGVDGTNFSQTKKMVLTK